MIWLAFIGGVGVGAYLHLILNDAIRLGQEKTHKREMDELVEELKRARAQVADLIGKE